MPRIAPSIAAAGVFSLFFFGGLWFLVMPELATIGTDRGALDSASQPLSAQSSASATDSASSGQIADASQQVGELLPSDDAQYDVSVQVEALAQSSGVTLSSLSLGVLAPGSSSSASSQKTAPVADGLSAVTVTVGVAGTYGNVQRFIIGLQGLSRLIQVNQVTVSTAAQSTTGSSGASSDTTPAASSTDQVAAQIVAYAYYSPSN